MPTYLHASIHAYLRSSSSVIFIYRHFDAPESETSVMYTTLFVITTAIRVTEMDDSQLI